MSWKETINSLNAQIAEGKTPSVEFDTLQDIKDFVEAIKQEFSLEGIKDNQMNIKAQVFSARWGLGPKQKVSLYDIVEGVSLGVKVFFNSKDNLRLFAAISEEAINNGSIKEEEEEDEQEEPQKQVDTTKKEGRNKKKIDTSILTLDGMCRLLNLPVIPSDDDTPGKNKDYYSVNPLAEEILDRLIKGWLRYWIGFAIIFGIVGVVFGIVQLFEGDHGGLIILGTLFVTVVIILLAYILWAINKVVINISRNLYNIKETLKANNKK